MMKIREVNWERNLKRQANTSEARFGYEILTDEKDFEGTEFLLHELEAFEEKNKRSLE